jgi:RIO kinase 1
VLDPVPVHSARPVPEWVIDEPDQVDEVLGLLKTGKEAEVFVLERTHGDRSCLLAHKRYRPTKVGKGVIEGLGFTKARSFANDAVYHEGKKFRYSRDQRAVERQTDYGKKLLADRWPGHELDILRKLWAAGADVPYPIEFIGDGMVMQYVGDHSQAAPRLVQARLSHGELAVAFGQLEENLRTFAAASVVHGDLSPYNVLWWDGRLWFIDFPQAADLVLNPHGFDLLHHDVMTMCTWFTRQGHACDGEALFAELLAYAF